MAKYNLIVDSFVIGGGLAKVVGSADFCERKKVVIYPKKLHPEWKRYGKKQEEQFRSELLSLRESGISITTENIPNQPDYEILRSILNGTSIPINQY